MTDDETLLQMAERNILAKEYAKAFSIWQRLANRGNAIAQAKLGICFYNGYGVTQDYAKAVYWFAKAAEQGLAAAQDDLGTCYYRGDGAAQDYAKAFYWFTKAVEQGLRTYKKKKRAKVLLFVFSLRLSDESRTLFKADKVNE